MYILWLSKQKIEVSVLAELCRPVLIPASLTLAVPHCWEQIHFSCRGTSGCLVVPKEATLLCQQCQMLLPALGTDPH